MLSQYGDFSNRVLKSKKGGRAKMPCHPFIYIDCNALLQHDLYQKRESIP